MKYFVDEETHWDVDGYWEQLRSLEARLSKPAFAILAKTSFHDAHVLSLQAVNLATYGRPRVKDPTAVEIRLWHRNEYVYTLRYGGVTAMNFAFDWRNQTYIGLDDQERFYQEDRGGVGDWLYDELTPVDETYLSHEVEFASGARLQLRFRRIACSRSSQKQRFRRPK